MGIFRAIMSVISTDGKTGTPFNLDKNHTVYYRGNGVNAVDAAHAAGFYKGYGYFTDETQSDVQISAKSAVDAIQVSYIVTGESVSPETESYFKGAAPGLMDLFPNRAVSFHLLDAHLKHLKAL